MNYFHLTQLWDITLHILSGLQNFKHHLTPTMECMLFPEPCRMDKGLPALFPSHIFKAVSICSQNLDQLHHDNGQAVMC